MALLDWIFGEDRIWISGIKLAAWRNAIAARDAEYDRRLQKLEGSYGNAMQGMQRQIAALESELDEKDAILEEQNDEASKIAAARKMIPDALGQMGFSPEQVTQAQAVLMRPDVQKMLEDAIQSYFPDTPVTMEGIMALAPVILNFMKAQGVAPQKQTALNPMDAMFAK